MWQGLRGDFRGMLGVVMGVGLMWGVCGIASAQSTREVTLVNIEFEGTKVWIPGPVVVHKGDRVIIRAINNVKSEPAVHGLAIDAFGVQALVNVGNPEIVELQADKAGIFPITCHLHPPHVGTQLVVLDR